MTTGKRIWPDGAHMRRGRQSEYSATI